MMFHRRCVHRQWGLIFRRLSKRGGISTIRLKLLTMKCSAIVEHGGIRYGGAVDLPRWVQSVVQEEWTVEVFDLELMMNKDIEEEMVRLLQGGRHAGKSSSEISVYDGFGEINEDFAFTFKQLISSASPPLHHSAI
ncbi:unnamed protein product [Lactuca saligna]|uniref:Uncharacterized protein n=1 Tax=Lactuca saligna TaxID=75948 RepID=A0AA35Z7E0_LACSI|nr:unnamed protein product [Lactuca saligna]